MTKPKSKRKAPARKTTRPRKAQPALSPMRHVRLAGYVFAGAAVLSIVLLAALFVDFRTLPDRAAKGAHSFVLEAGFGVDQIDVRGARRFTYRQIADMADVDSQATIFSQDLAAIRGRIEKQTWIKSARVSRHFPGRLVIDIEEHQAFARWQRDGQFYLIDDVGMPFIKIARSQWRSLPLVVGMGANSAAPMLHTALENYPYLASRLSSATWVGARRWDLYFEGGVLVRLPEQDVPEKLDQLSRMNARDGLLAAGPMRIDMRMDHMLAISTDPGQFTPKPRPRRSRAKALTTAS